DVIKNILLGNTALFELLIRRYNPYLYKVGRSYGFNHQDTEDLMQETFINCYTHLAQFAERSTFKTWLIKIMLHQCSRKASRHSYKKELSTEEVPDNSTFMFQNNNHSGNDHTVINRELNKVVETCLQQLPENYRITFTLRELNGLSVAETAELLHTSASNVKVRLNRAKAILRREIEKTYSVNDIFEFNLIYCDKMVNDVMKQIEALNNSR
ncbi:MAG TPA: sigma-70 family RNA polymerase sigma factor, partial [Lacibacter sp.]|nr:sigma-70 family RNA polymerase sigma factor [Lacibacter sp.]